MIYFLKLTDSSTPWVSQLHLQLNLILWRNVWLGDSKAIGWDDSISSCHYNDWVTFFKGMFEMRHLKFVRCLKPLNARDELPVLVMFSDGSISAYGGCADLRWVLVDGTFESRLIAAKSKICPVKVISMNGDLLSKRLQDFIARETRIKFSKVYFITDAQIVYSMLQRESYGFSTFIGLRVGEIQRSTNPSSWYWTGRSHNMADWITKGKHPSALHSNSMWQRGPDCLKLHESRWPLYQTSTVDIPEVIRPVMITIKTPQTLAHRIDLSRFSNYHILIRTTARVLSIYKANPKPSLFNAIINPSSEDYELSVRFWVMHLQSSFSDADMNNKYKRLSPRCREDGIWVVGSRTAITGV